MKHSTYYIHNVEPLDISSIKVEIRNSSIGKVMDMIKNKDIVLPISEDRYSWDSKKKSQFLESVILGLPIPSLFFYIDEKSGKLLIIDGVQRLRSLYDYIVGKNVCLNDLQLINEDKFNKHFDELPYSVRLDIKMHSISLNVISGINSAEAKYTIFKRYCSKSNHLSPAEIRYNLFPGNANNIIERMCNEDIFKMLVSSKIHNIRRKCEEFASRFIALYLADGIIINKDEDIEMLSVSTYEILNNEFDTNDTLQLLEIFENSLSTCYKILGENAFAIPGKNKVSINVFEILTIPIARLSKFEQDLFLERKEIFKSKYFTLFKKREFASLLSNKSTYNNIKNGIDIINNLIRDILGK